MSLLRVRTTAKKSKNLTRAQVEAEANFQRLQKEWDKIPKFATSTVPPSKKGRKPTLEDLVPDPPKPARILTGSTAPPKANTYSGEAIGIATMHKSNTVPVYSKEAAEDIAKMRRN